MNPSPVNKPAPIHRKGFAMFETILAVTICGVMATGIAVAIQQITKLSANAKRESALSRIIHNEVMFAATKPRIEEGKVTKQVEEWDVEVETIITPLEDLQNEDGVALNKLYLIEVNAVWWQDGEYVKQTSETWRHADLYVR